jgi:hypothetical protein
VTAMIATKTEPCRVCGDPVQVVHGMIPWCGCPETKEETR